MGLFDNREADLAKQVVDLQSQLDEAKRRASKAELSLRSTETKLGEREAEASKLRKSLGDRQDIPDKALSAIQIFVRVLGAIAIISSLAFARSLAKGTPSESLYLTVWGLYLFCQFAGLYLAGFGAPTTLRSIAIFGIYMSALFVFVAASIVLSLFGFIALPYTRELMFLAVINALGIPTLIYVERRIHAAATNA